ncbi:WD domain [Trypanosoma vivax]|nr:poly(A) export protein [Trypanosoma vivax]KAH8618671.1 WD domain [Trypanosoma vivax]
MYAFKAYSRTSVHEVEGAPVDCVSSVRFSPLGCPYVLLGVTSWDKSCRVWQVGTQTGRESISSQPMALTTNDSPLLDMSFSADGRAFLAGCNKTVTMWNLMTNDKTVVASHDLPVSCVSYVSPPSGSGILITGSWDGRLRFWDLRQQRPAKEEVFNEPVFALDAQKSYPMAACVTGRKIHIYNLQTLTMINELKPPSIVKFNLRCVACSPNHDGVSVGSSEGRVSFVPLQQEPGCTFKAHIVVENDIMLMHQTNFCAINPILPQIVTGGGDGRLGFWDYKRRANIGYVNAELSSDTRNNSISAGDISADGTLLAYARSYDWAMGKSKAIPNEPHSIHIRPAQFKPSTS